MADHGAPEVDRPTRRSESRARLTLRWEAVRAVLVRPAQLAAQGSGVLLLVAIQHYHASDAAKALVTAAVFIGMLLAPVVVTVVARTGVAVSRALACLVGLAGLALVAAGLSPGFGGFLCGVLIGAPLLESITPLVTALWQRNVPRRWRGRLFGVVGSLAGAAGILTGLAIALYLGDDIGRYRPVVVGLGAAVALAAVAAARIPAGRLAGPVRNPVEQIAVVWSDRTFGYLIVVWFLLGLGNLATVPLRLEYIASGDYGFDYSARRVLYLAVVIPQAVALLSTVAWGRWFDRFDFLWERMAINLAFIGSIVLFFRPSLPLQVAGSVLFGIGQGGGQIAWNLWVTKYAPPARTADYMAVHTFLTGVRGIIAPFLAYRLLADVSLDAANAVSLTLLAAASVMLLPPMWRAHRRGRAG